MLRAWLVLCTSPWAIGNLRPVQFSDEVYLRRAWHRVRPGQCLCQAPSVNRACSWGPCPCTEQGPDTALQSDTQALDRCVQTSFLTLTSLTQGPNIPKSSLWSCTNQECPQRGPSSRHTCKTDPVVDQGRHQSKSSFSQKHETFTMSHYYMLPDLLSLKASGTAKRLHRAGSHL